MWSSGYYQDRCHLMKCFCCCCVIQVSGEPCAAVRFCLPWNHFHWKLLDQQDELYFSTNSNQNMQKEIKKIGLGLMKIWSWFDLSTEKPTSVTSCLYSSLSQSWMINLTIFRRFQDENKRDWRVSHKNYTWTTHHLKMSKKNNFTRFLFEGLV